MYILRLKADASVKISSYSLWVLGKKKVVNLGNKKGFNWTLTAASNIYSSIHYVIIIIPGYQNKYSHKLKYCWKTAERP